MYNDETATPLSSINLVQTKEKHCECLLLQIFITSMQNYTRCYVINPGVIKYSIWRSVTLAFLSFEMFWIYNLYDTNSLSQIMNENER